MRSCHRRWSCRVLLAASGLSIACNDDGSTSAETDGTTTASGDGLVCEDAPTESSAAFSLAETYCAEIFGCHCPLQEQYETYEGCVVILAAEFQAAFDLAVTHGLVYDADCTQLQISFARAFGCDFPDAEVGQLCADVLCDPFNGDRGIGDECIVLDAGRVSFSDCAPGLGCEPDCGGCVDNRTTRSVGEPCGTCFGFCGRGLTCSLEGQELMGTCIVREGSGPGDPCASFLDCDDDLYCPDGTCVAKLGEGGACETGIECQGGFYCSEQQCRPQKGPDEACTSSDECIAACSSQGLCSFPLCAE